KTIEFCKSLLTVAARVCSRRIDNPLGTSRQQTTEGMAARKYKPPFARELSFGHRTNVAFFSGPFIANKTHLAHKQGHHSGRLSVPYTGCARWALFTLLFYTVA
ncbi:MAG: hypothetical protein QNK37_32015, partial [Acidobacteriota bacterium]|nr:hypothetical protein [Acidobacteriota bacterium]